MVTTIYIICHKDSQHLAGSISHLHVATTLVFGISSVAKVVVKLVLRLEPSHVLIVIQIFLVSLANSGFCESMFHHCVAST
jgi:hypothetical protein